MALDPKAVLQQNKILVGLYAAAIVPIVLWVLLVMNGVQNGAPSGGKPSFEVALRQLGQKTMALRSYQSRIKQMKDAAKKVPPEQVANPVFTPKHIAEYQKQNDELKAQYDLMTKLVSDRDSALEQYFSDPKIKQFQGKTELPPVGDFDAVFKTEIARLTKEYGDLVVDNSNPQKPCLLWQDQTTPGAQKSMQKKFWIQERILMALKKGGAEQLLDKVDFGAGGAPPATPGQQQAKALVTPIPAHVTFRCTFRDVPKIVRELLAQDIVFRLVKFHVELLPFGFTRGDKEGFAQPFKVNVDTPKGLYDRTWYDGVLVSKDKFAGNEEAILPEPRIKVTIDLEALDFDTDTINATANPPADAPAPPPADAPVPGKKK